MLICRQLPGASPSPWVPYKGSALDPLGTSAIPRPLAYISSTGADPGFYVRGVHFLARGLGTAAPEWAKLPGSSWELENIGPLF